MNALGLNEGQFVSIHHKLTPLKVALLNNESHSIPTITDPQAVILVPYWVYRYMKQDHQNAVTNAWICSPALQRIDNLLPPINITSSQIVTVNADHRVSSRIRLSRVSALPFTPNSNALLAFKTAAGNSAACNELMMQTRGFVDEMTAWIESVASQCDECVLASDTLIKLDRMGLNIMFRVVSIIDTEENPCQIALCTAPTSKFEVVSSETTLCDSWQLQSIVESHRLGGYQRSSDELMNVLKSIFYRTANHRSLLVEPCRGVYVVGPKGIGKEFFITKTVCAEMRLPIVYTHICEETHCLRQQGTSQSSLRKSIVKARLSAPCVLFIDGLDLLSITASSKTVPSDFSLQEVASHVAKMLDATMMVDPDGLEESMPAVCVVAPVCDTYTLPRCLQLGSFFSESVNIPLPSTDQRKDICYAWLEHIGIMKGKDASLDALLVDLAEKTPGYVARDLLTYLKNAICHFPTSNRAAMQQQVLGRLIRPYMAETSDTIQKLKKSLNSHPPPPSSIATSTRFDTRKRGVRWDSVGGYSSTKAKLRQYVLWPIERADKFKQLGIQAPSGILLYGPSGCGKSMLVHALASSCAVNFMMVKSSDIFSKYFGDSERNIRDIFAAASQLKPCIVFMDEFDAISTRRGFSSDSDTSSSDISERILSTLLNEMDGIQDRTGVIVIACTNRPERIDAALLRPGRLDHHLYVPMPTAEDRRAILNAIVTDGTRLILNEDEIEAIVTKTDGFTGADVETLIREAGIAAMRQEMRQCDAIRMEHVKSALDGRIHEGTTDGWWRPGMVNQSDIDRFDKFQEK